MYQELKSFMNKNDKTLILSPSANEGIVEKLTQERLRKDGYDCTFIISDLIGQSLYSECKDDDNIKYIHRDQDAKELKLSDKVDIIVDIKGATWHSLANKPRRTRVKRFIKLMKCYEENLANDDSILFLESYTINDRWYSIKNTWRYKFNAATPYKNDKYHEEQSTMFYVHKLLKKRNIENLFIESVVENNLIHTAHISKRNLVKTINALENSIHQAY